ncbi:MAG: hypothetical protein HYU27_01005 [Acidobacteria bacterium]|nr:hypothetical protein [Acidobacteriota bacterium]
MLDWLAGLVASTTTTITFLTIFLVGVVFSVFSLILGGHGHGDHTDTAGHDVGRDADAGHDAGSDHDDAGAGDYGDDGGSLAGGLFSVGILSVRGIALLATGFGGIGFLIHVSTGRLMFSTASAFVGGYVFAFAVLYTLKVFKSQQANSLISMSTAVGAEGIVTVSIPENGLGEISLSVSGMEMFKPARSRNGAPIRSGTRVQVTQISGGTFVVTPSEVASSVAQNP